MEFFEAVHSRRSHPLLIDPAPSAAELRRMLRAAMVAPDHGRQSPWRFVVLSGTSKEEFADVMEKAVRARAEGAVDPAQIHRERSRLERAPVVVVTVCVAGASDRIPRWERLAATAAATQNLLLAATALGYGSIWRTGWPAADVIVKEALGFGGGDDIVGFVYLGTIPPTAPAPARQPRHEGMACVWPMAGWSGLQSNNAEVEWASR